MSPDDAMERCRDRLAKLRAMRKLFKEPITIFSDGLVRLTGAFAEGVVVNWETTLPEGRIANLMPDRDEHTGVMAFAASRETDEPVEPFLVFGVDAPGISDANSGSN